MVFQCFCFPIWPWCSDLQSEPTPASWRSIHCHFPLSGGTFVLTGEVHWPLLWPSPSRGLFSLSGFSCPSLPACPPVLQTNAHRGAWAPGFIAHSWCLIYVLWCPPSLSKAVQGWGSKQGKRGGQRCLMGQRAAAEKWEQLAAETAAAQGENAHWIWHDLIKRAP